MLKIQSDRVIIDGHEPTKEQCETMTLLANALAKSDNFETVEYRDGYAEFEKVGKAEELKFPTPGAPSLITVIFDSHITKVVYHGPSDIEFTTSGESRVGTAHDGAEYIFTVTLETGYVLDTVTLSDATPDYGTLVAKTDTTFTILAGVDGINQTITLTSKQATSKVTVDLTTLPGWESLSGGTHNITIVAKAAGFKDSAPSAAVQVEKAPAVVMPVKGDIITMDSKQYRVLKVNGTVAEVLCMYDANSSIQFDTNSDYNNTYAGKNIDTYCNSTFYSGLSAAMKSAIVDKTFTQDSWNYTTSAPAESHYTGKCDSGTYYVTLNNATFGTSITRHCYVLSVQEVLDYLNATTSMGISDTTLSDTNLWKMFWNQSTSPGPSYPWLRSAVASIFDSAFNIYSDDGSLSGMYVSGDGPARPAFQIDLSKIAWSK